MLTRVAQIVTAAHRDLQSCMRSPINEPDRTPKLGQSDLLSGFSGQCSKYLHVYYVSYTVFQKTGPLKQIGITSSKYACYEWFFTECIGI